MSALITLRQVEKTYRLGEIQVPALRDITLEIYSGDFLVVTGRNGSGKSTLLYQLGLLDRPDHGEIIIDNQNVTKISDESRRKIRLTKIGYIFQNYALIAELTALENIMLPAMMQIPRTQAKQRAITLLEKVGLSHRSKHLAKRLSGGEQQKVAIARALCNNPQLIIADEPTANLDSIAAKDVMEIFKSLNQKDHHTVIMVTHEPEETAYANRQITLHDGRIIT